VREVIGRVIRGERSEPAMTVHDAPPVRTPTP
jgi:hypothetical protein